MKKIFPVVLLTFVNVLGFSIIIPILPFIVEQYGGGSIVYGLLLSSYSAFQFIGAPFLGELSDRYGRKPILILSQAGTLLSWIIFAIAYFVPMISWGGLVLPLWVIFFSRIIDGLTGGNVSVANAYLSDISSPKDKAKNFGILGATFGVGFIVGPALGGFFAMTQWGWLGTIGLATLISLFTLIMIVFLPESLDREHRKPHQPIHFWRELNLWGKLQEFSIQPFVRFLFQFRGVLSLVMSGYMSIMIFYMIDRFGLAQDQVGLLLLVVGIFSIINQLLLVGPIVRFFGELKALFYGQWFLGVGLFLLPFISEVWAYFIVYYLINLGISVSMPTMQALLTNSVDKRQQGEIMGIDQSIDAFMRAFMPTLTGILYFYIGGSVFWIFAGIVTLLIGWFFVKNAKSLS